MTNGKDGILIKAKTICTYRESGLGKHLTMLLANSLPLMKDTRLRLQFQLWFTCLHYAF